MSAQRAEEAAHRRLVIGNWKMNGLLRDLDQLETIDRAAAHATNVDVALSLPASLLAPAAARVRSIGIGAQDCHQEAAGAFTGSLSAVMLHDAGAAFTLIGHSERRSAHAESNTVVRAKATAALQAGLRAVVCVGENAEERDAGNALATVSSQLDGSLPARFTPEQLVIAYEPVWAIGTGVVPTSEDLSKMHMFIRCEVAKRGNGSGIRVIYGGSVSLANVDLIFATEGVDGVLVGGASLSAEGFTPIIEAAARLALATAV